MKKCADCGRPVIKSGSSLARCLRCTSRANYSKKNGVAVEIRIVKCVSCGKEFQDYASNLRGGRRRQGSQLLCSKECRASWTAAHNSMSRGGDGVPRGKSERDALDYRKHANKRRTKANALYAAKREEILAKLKAKNRALKAEVVAAYGGKCACCGEATLEFLTIDHTNGDGAEHRRKVGKGKKIYADLKAMGFPKDGYQVLCFNCNICLGFYGYCPHRPDVKRVINKVPRNPGRKRIVV